MLNILTELCLDLTTYEKKKAVRKQTATYAVDVYCLPKILIMQIAVFWYVSLCPL